MAQDRDTFYVVGGYNGTTSSFDTVYRYEPPSDSWTLLPERMAYKRYAATAMVVKGSLFPSCD